MRHTWGVWLLLGLLWLFTLPLRPLFDPDEGRYAEVPREMVANADWITPTLDGVKYFEKPPLQYWTTAALYSAFGASEWTSRLWSAALGFLCLPLVFAFTRKLGHSQETAAVAAGILVVNPYFMIVSQVNLLDQAFSCIMVAAVFCFVLAQRAGREPRPTRGWMLATWALLALAVLSKGLVAIVLPGMTLAIYLLWTRDTAPLRRLHILAGLPLFAALVLPWFVLVQQRNPEFAQFFFVHEHFARYLTVVHDRVEPWYYFPGLVLVAITPVIGSWRYWRDSMHLQATAAGEFQVEKFLAIWCGVVLLFFSASHSKLAPYVLPMMPPLAVLLARGTAADPRALRRISLVLTGSLCFFALALLAYTWRRNGTIELTASLWAASTIVACVIAWGFVRTHQVPAPAAPRWLALAAASIFGFQALTMTYASLPPCRSGQLLAAQVSPLLRADASLYSVGQFRHSLTFYLQRTMSVFAFRGELDFGLTQAGASAATSDVASFRSRWEIDHDALAFIEPTLYQQLAASGMPGHVVAHDARSVVVSRR